MWPVIIRELRAGSRQWGTYWLRVLAAAFAIGAFVLFMEQGRGMRTGREGAELFSTMHRILLATIAVVVPLMTSDCISRERREGTLGLLFLTNLTAREIILAKAIAHGLRACALWAAVLPLMALPILLGGVDWREVVLSSRYSLEFIGMNLVVGLVASAFTRSQVGAICASICLCVLAMTFFAFGNMWAVQLIVQRGPSWARIPAISFDFGSAVRFVCSPDFSRFPSQIQFAVWMGSLLFAVILMLLSMLILWLTAWHLRRNWQDKPKTKRQTDTEKFFCSPVFMTSLFHRWMRRSIERNPIGWLEKRSWTGRITAWIWLAVMISFASALAYSPVTRDGMASYNVLMFMLLGSMAYVAAGSFRRERETGALELILVTPLSERHIIFGRLRGLWGQFLPTFLLWVAVVLYLSTALHDWQVANVLRFAALYFVVPVVGLYFSLRCRFALLAWIATLTVCFTVCFALPQLLSWVVSLLLADWFNDLLPGISPDGLVIRVVRWGFENVSWFTVLALQVTLATVLLWRLRVNLVRRTFSFR